MPESSLASLATEHAAEHYHDLDTWSPLQRLQALVDANTQAVAAVQAALPALEQAAQGIIACLQRGGRLVYIGAGTSGRLAAQDAAELPPTFGFAHTVVLLAGGDSAQSQAQEGAEDDREAAVQAVKAAALNADDACVAVAASGNTPYTVAGLEQAKAQGAFTVGIANNPESALLRSADVAVLLHTGAEVLAGSTRLCAGSAQKIALNALSTCVLVELGGAYQNLMVGMQASNQKLRQRAHSIVQQATQAPEQDIQQALEQASWHMREAIVMLKTGMSYPQARQALQRHGQKVRAVLQAENPIR